MHKFIAGFQLRVFPPAPARPAKLQVQRADAGLRTRPHYFCSIRELLIVVCILDLQRIIVPVASEVDYKVPKTNLAH